MAYSTNFIKYHPNIKDKLDTKKSKVERLLPNPVLQLSYTHGKVRGSIS